MASMVRFSQRTSTVGMSNPTLHCATVFCTVSVACARQAACPLLFQLALQELISVRLISQDRCRHVNQIWRSRNVDAPIQSFSNFRQKPFLIHVFRAQRLLHDALLRLMPGLMQILLAQVQEVLVACTNSCAIVLHLKTVPQHVGQQVRMSCSAPALIRPGCRLSVPSPASSTRLASGRPLRCSATSEAA